MLSIAQVIMDYVGTFFAIEFSDSNLRLSRQLNRLFEKEVLLQAIAVQTQRFLSASVNCCIWIVQG